MILKQGSNYKSESTDIGVSTTEDVVDDQQKKSKIPPAALIVAFIAVVVILLVTLLLYSRTDGKDVEDTPKEDDEIIVGDDAYWSQFDTIHYTDDERQELRAWGYTGDEIEANETNGTSAAELIAAAKKAQEEKQQTLSNPASPEYQALLNNTWLGQPAISLPTYVKEETEKLILYDTFVYNADYEKVPAHGHTLFLKVYLDDGSYTFMECPLVRYLQLPESGNIVVQYQTSKLGNATVISDMREVNVE